jgi:hypothetical protein
MRAIRAFSGKAGIACKDSKQKAQSQHDSTHFDPPQFSLNNDGFALFVGVFESFNRKGADVHRSLSTGYQLGNQSSSSRTVHEPMTRKTCGRN